MTDVAVVILAAGAGRRLGGVAKALLRSGDGPSFLEQVSRCATDGGARSGTVVVVAEPHRAATAAEARALGLTVVVNTDPGRGMASSIEVGFRYASRNFESAAAALLWPVDHFAVRPDTVRGLVERSDRQTIVVPRFGRRGGHPTSFGAALWDELASCSQTDHGARSVVRADLQRVVGIEVDDPGVVADVDTEVDRP